MLQKVWEHFPALRNFTMWCTRWFLPLLLLPLPTAPPYFLLLFLFSLTMHAKPCFYCIVLLTTLFVSSCYWQPLPLDSPLSTPWAENITTFAEALNATIIPNYSRPLPKVIRTVDRCWCDFSAGGLFEPFNVSHWERVSVQRLKDDLERQQKLDEPSVLATESAEQASSATVVVTPDMPRTPAPAPATPNRTKFITNSANLWSLLRPFNIKTNNPQRHIPSPSPEPSMSQIPSLDHVGVNVSSRPHSKEDLPFIRKEYDLRTYGLGVIMDFSWTR